MTPSTFAEILEDRLKHVENAVALIVNSEGDRPELDNLRGHLIDILDIVERNPGIEAAADDLYELQPDPSHCSPSRRATSWRSSRTATTPAPS